ncbi:hypothetical protein [Halostella sp. PRR32]|uniref:hypothetical protein n=1 Tax=Halostella sp. PRR32 TaxID=3098147 RepID=UPI002B1D4E7E|nr:hypothetical protein [Halostella sp. PRR32]
MSTDLERRRESRDRYQAVLRTVAHQTSPKQSPGARPTTIRLLQATHGQHDHDDVDSAMRAAIENDDLLKWTDADGRVRLTLYAEPDLKRLAQHIGGTVKDPHELARVNQALAEVRDE